MKITTLYSYLQNYINSHNIEYQEVCISVIVPRFDSEVYFHTDEFILDISTIYTDPDTGDIVIYAS